MDNNELNTLFQSVDECGNAFDRYLKLQSIKKQYKHSIFYKQTHLTLNKAYQLYKQNKFHTLDSLLNNPFINAILKGDSTQLSIAVEEFIETFDFTKLDGLFSYITDKLNNINIPEIKEELEKTISDFKKSLNI